MQQWRQGIRRLTMALMVVLLLVGTGLGSHVAQAAGCTVGSGYATIQAAVNDANCTTITVPAGIYTEHVTIARGYDHRVRD